MEKISSILVPFDFSESAIHALDYCISFVGNTPVKINVIYVSDHNENDIERLRKAYLHYKEKNRDLLKLPMRWILGWGNFIETILEAREEKHTEIIIMGTSGLAKEKEFSNTAKLVAKAKCPVIVVPENCEQMHIKNIALILGKNEIDNPKALHSLLEITRRFNAKVHVLTVQNNPEIKSYSQIDEKNENTLMYYLEDFYEQHSFTENEDILQGVFNYSESHEIDLIAILPRHHTVNATPSEGKLTSELVMKSKIPVLTIE